MKSHEILELLTDTRQMSAGKAIGKLRRVSRVNSAEFSSAQARFLEDYVELRRDQRRGGPAPYQRPIPNAEVAGGHLGTRKRGPLTEAEFMWLGRLPTDPEKVPFRDAVQLSIIADSVPRMEHRDHAILVDSIWGPVKEYHDQVAARVKLDQLRSVRPSVPESAVAAVADALSSELPGLTDDERAARASAMVREAKERLVRDHEASLVKAEQELTSTTEAADSRGALTA